MRMLDYFLKASLAKYKNMVDSCFLDQKPVYIVVCFFTKISYSFVHCVKTLILVQVNLFKETAAVDELLFRSPIPCNCTKYEWEMIVGFSYSWNSLFNSLRLLWLCWLVRHGILKYLHMSKELHNSRRLQHIPIWRFVKVAQR